MNHHGLTYVDVFHPEEPVPISSRRDRRAKQLTMTQQPGALGQQYINKLELGIDVSNISPPKHLYSRGIPSGNFALNARNC